MEDCPFQAKSDMLEAGDTLLLYTDGVTEAMNPRAEEYGSLRMLSCVQDNAAAPAGQIVENLLDDIRRHVCHAEQSDDLTLLCIKRRTPGDRSPER